MLQQRVEPITFECWRESFTTTPDNLYDNIMIIIIILIMIIFMTMIVTPHKIKASIKATKVLTSCISYSTS